MASFIDILNVIADYLPYINNVMISFICKEANFAIKKNISFLQVVINELRKNLSIEETQQFLQHIQNSDSVISGSFILAVIYGETWYNDIDIYENINYYSEYFESSDLLLDNIHDDFLRIDRIKTDFARNSFVLNEMFNIYTINGTKNFIKEYQFTKLTKFLFDHWEKYHINLNLFDMWSDLNDEKRDLTTHIRTFEIRNTLFQHIPIECDQKKIIKLTFDADILKNMFDGKNLKVWSWDLLLKRESYIKPSGLLFHSYCSGSNTEETFNDHCSYIFKITHKRINKYKKRGIKLIIHKHFIEMAEYLVKQSNCSDYRDKSKIGKFFDRISNHEFDLEQFN